MTPQQIDELDRLAAVLSSAAAQIKRAAGVLRLTGDLDRLEKRLAALLPSDSAACAVPSVSAGLEIGDGPPASPAGSFPRSSTGRDVAGSACAVFADSTQRGGNHGNQGVVDRQKTIAHKTTAPNRVQSVRRGNRDIDVVPF